LQRGQGENTPPSRRINVIDSNTLVQSKRNIPRFTMVYLMSLYLIPSAVVI